MREEDVERIDEAVNDGKLTWEKPALKVFSIDDTDSGSGSVADGQDGSGMNHIGGG